MKYAVWLGQVVPMDAEAMAFEQREKLLEIVRPKAADYMMLDLVKAKNIKPTPGKEGAE